MPEQYPVKSNIKGGVFISPFNFDLLNLFDLNKIFDILFQVMLLIPQNLKLSTINTNYQFMQIYNLYEKKTNKYLFKSLFFNVNINKYTNNIFV